VVFTLRMQDDNPHGRQTGPGITLPREFHLRFDNPPAIPRIAILRLQARPNQRPGQTVVAGSNRQACPITRCRGLRRISRFLSAGVRSASSMPFVRSRLVRSRQSIRERLIRIAPCSRSRRGGFNDHHAPGCTGDHEERDSPKCCHGVILTSHDDEVNLKGCRPGGPRITMKRMNHSWYPPMSDPRFLILCLPFLFFQMACNDSHTGIRPFPPDGSELPILRQISRTHSHEQRAMRIVVRDQAQFARIPLEDVPVDFKQEMLLIVTLGRVSSDQYAVKVDRVWRDGGKLRVTTSLSRPKPNAPISVASPYCIAIVPRCDLNVSGFLPEPPPRDRTWGQSEWQPDM